MTYDLNDTFGNIHGIRLEMQVMVKEILKIGCLMICMLTNFVFAQTTTFVKYHGYLIPVQERDSDGDGVYDRTDICANTSTATTVDGLGCSVYQAALLVNCVDNGSGSVRLGFECYSYESKDTDRDGLLDTQDSYPHQSALMCAP